MPFDLPAFMSWRIRQLRHTRSRRCSCHGRRSSRHCHGVTHLALAGTVEAEPGGTPRHVPAAAKPGQGNAGTSPVSGGDSGATSPTWARKPPRTRGLEPTGSRRRLRFDGPATPHTAAGRDDPAPTRPDDRGTECPAHLRTLAAATLLGAAATAPGTGKATASTGVKVVIDHVDNPRGLALRPGGQLYVAAAGKAGSFCPAPDSCGGLTSYMLRRSNGETRRIAGGLPSLGGQTARSPSASTMSR